MSEDGQSRVDYEFLLQKHPWIIEPKQNCILSPDSDGLLCGLLMSKYLGWKIRGFYDGKVLILEEGIKPRDCVFLDMEIFHPNIRSVGQHMVTFDKNKLPDNWGGFNQCIAANNLRNFDFKNDFTKKYPLGTIHLLLSIISQKINISISKEAVCPLLYTDGVFKNQFNYPENCLSWLNFLGADLPGNPLQNIFLDKHYSTYELMLALQDIFFEIHDIGAGHRGGDKIKISSSTGQLLNIDEKNNCLEPSTKKQAEEFLNILAAKTGWSYDPKHWSWGPYQTFCFKKGSIKPGKARYNTLMEKKPISLAIISRESIEYTIDEDGIF